MITRASDHLSLPKKSSNDSTHRVWFDKWKICCMIINDHKRGKIEFTKKYSDR